MGEIKPTGEYVIIVPEIIEPKSESGIVLPGKVDQGRIRYGEVIAVGPGLYKGAPMELKSGDQVMYQSGSYDEIMLSTGVGHLTRQSSVVAVILNKRDAESPTKS